MTIDNKFGTFISKVGSLSGRNSQIEKSDTFSLSKVQKNHVNTTEIDEKRGVFQPEFQFSRADSL